MKNDHLSTHEPRKFLGIHFVCCNIYVRIYRNKEKTAYEGRCPRCGKKVQVPIGAQGTGSRFFVAE
jgi:PHP family Zn ribbon phosphoesterase